jgi:hypothetical protein
VGNTLRLADREPTCPTTPEEFEAETALADARIADDAEHLCSALGRPGQRRFQGRDLVETADEAREAPSAGDFERGAEHAHALELVDTNRLARLAINPTLPG